MDLTEKTENIKRHPWELSRTYCLLKVLPKNNNHTNFADIGSGDKYFTSKLLPFTEGDIYAIDNEYCQDKSIEEGVICLNDICLLKNNSIDYLIMMDVLEHIENDSDFLKKVLIKLKPGGEILITVPAMQFLFSSHDVFLKHYRRYSREKLNTLLKDNDLMIVRSHYFYSTLFILRSISLLFEKLKFNKKKKNVGVGLWKFNSNNGITRLLFHWLNFDFLVNKLLSKLGIRIPGLSLLAICKKKL